MSRCLKLLVIASAVLALASPLAQAQLNATPPFRVDVTPTQSSVFPGETANFTITIGNDALLDRTATMTVTSQLPVNWTYSFTPDPVTVNRSSSANTTLSVFVPSDASPQTQTVVFEANDTLGGFTRSQVNVTVKARPPAPVPDGAPAPPRVVLSVSGAESFASGTTAQGSVTILHDDPSRSALDIQISASAPTGWNAYLRPSDQNRRLDLGQSATLPVFVDIPTLAQDTTVNVTVTAKVGDTVFTARWPVTGLAAPSGSTQTGGAPATTGGTGTTTSNGPSGTQAPRGPNFEILVQPLELDIEPNGDETANVKLSNTGSTPLTIVLTAPPPSQWRPFDLADAITLAPGETREVPMTLHAPAGVPPGGVAEITVQGAADGIVRRSPLFVRTVPPSIPVDESPAATQTQAPAAPEGTGLPTLGPAALVAVGLAAAGTTALVFANRPLREKILWGAAGLYTRLARPDVLGHEDREKLYRLVETQPGIHFHALQRDLAWNTGTLTYHIRVLEKHGFVVSRRDGLYRRFYLAGAAPRKETFENQGPTGLRADVMEAIRNSPGISQSDLALGLGANKQTVNYHVKALERAGTIRVEKRGRDTFLYPATPTAPGADTARA